MSLSIAQWPLPIARVQSPSAMLAAGACLLSLYAIVGLLPLQQEVSGLHAQLAEIDQRRVRLGDRRVVIESLRQELEETRSEPSPRHETEIWIEPLIRQVSQAGLRLVRLQGPVLGGGPSNAAVSISLVGTSLAMLSALKAVAENGNLPGLSDLRLRLRDGTRDVELTLSAVEKPAAPVPTTTTPSRPCDFDFVRDPFTFGIEPTGADPAEVGETDGSPPIQLFGVVEGFAGRRALLGHARTSARIVAVGVEVDGAIVTSIERTRVVLRRRDGSTATLRLREPREENR